MAGEGSVGEVLRVFLRLGLTSFGGPAAHVATMRDELVRRRGWLTDAAFLDLVGVASAIPGPTSTELALHVGHRRAGWPGFAVAGAGFILPAVALVIGAAWAYVALGSRPEAAAVLAGMAPVVVAIVGHAALGLARTAVRGPFLAVLAAGAALAALARIPEPAILFAGATAGLAAHEARSAGDRAGGPRAVAIGGFGGLGLTAGTVAIAAAPLGLFLVFAKIGALLFGSGYVLVAFLDADLVRDLGWLTERQLLDAVAVGQLTPGPLFSTATFVGYLLAGPAGALAATVGIFLPAFAFVALSIPVLDRLARSVRARATLDGLNAAALGLLAAVTVVLARESLLDPLGIVIAGGAILALVRTEVAPGLLVLAGALLGLVRAAATGA